MLDSEGRVSDTLKLWNNGIESIDNLQTVLTSSLKETCIVQGTLTTGRCALGHFLFFCLNDFCHDGIRHSLATVPIVKNTVQNHLKTGKMIHFIILHQWRKFLLICLDNYQYISVICNYIH